MTTFRRRGHWRTSRNGTSYWVDEHDVTRDLWLYGGYSKIGSISFFSELEGLQAERGKSSRFVKPNARCPVCNSTVFFYQNEFGSRVYFDELGPPWPKHGCTNMEKSIWCGPSSGIECPTLRPDDERQRIEIILAQRFRENLPKRNSWKPLTINFLIKKRNQTFFITKDSSGKLNFFVGINIRQNIRRGDLIILKNNEMHFIDLKTLTPNFFKVSKIRSAASFASQIASVD